MKRNPNKNYLEFDVKNPDSAKAILQAYRKVIEEAEDGFYFNFEVIEEKDKAWQTCNFFHQVQILIPQVKEEYVALVQALLNHGSPEYKGDFKDNDYMPFGYQVIFYLAKQDANYIQHFIKFMASEYDLDHETEQFDWMRSLMGIHGWENGDLDIAVARCTSCSGQRGADDVAHYWIDDEFKSPKIFNQFLEKFTIANYGENFNKIETYENTWEHLTSDSYFGTVYIELIFAKVFNIKNGDAIAEKYFKLIFERTMPSYELLKP